MEKDTRVNIKLNIRITNGLCRYIIQKLSDPIGQTCMELDGERVLITKAEIITEDPHEKEQMLTNCLLKKCFFDDKPKGCQFCMFKNKTKNRHNEDRKSNFAEDGANKGAEQ